MEDNSIMPGGAVEDAHALNLAHDAPGDVISTSGASVLSAPKGNLPTLAITTPRIAIAPGIS